MFCDANLLFSPDLNSHRVSYDVNSCTRRLFDFKIIEYYLTRDNLVTVIVEVQWW